MNPGVGSGLLHGGWEFVIAAYSVSALVFAGYFLSVHSRYRAERRQAARETDASRSSHE
jgi:hypothetical protein